MIRRLMAGVAVVALMSGGAFTASTASAAETQSAQPPAAQQDLTAGPAESSASETGLTLDQPLLASVLIGDNVYASAADDAENIGDVNDLIVDQNGQVTQAVIGVGGFLGIGEKNVAVPVDKLQVMVKDGEVRLVYAATRDQLEAAPEFDRTAYDPAAKYAEEQAAQNTAVTGAPTGTDSSGGALAPALAPTAPADQMAANPPAVDDMTNAPASDMTNAPADQTAASDFQTFNPDQIRASTLMGQSVYGQDDESIGKVSDLVLEQDGKTRAALIDVGGFLGVGAKTVAIPFEQIKIGTVTPDATATSDQQVPQVHVTVAMTKDQLSQLPQYQSAQEQAAASAVPPATGTDVPAATGADQNAATAMNSPAPADANNATAPADQNSGTANDSNMAANAPDQNQPLVTGSVGTSLQPAAQDIAASDLIGATVYGPDDKTIGKIDDLVFKKDGTIEAVVVDVGGWLGIGAKPVAISFDQLQTRRDESGAFIVALDTTKDQLKNAPTYEVKAL